MTTINYLKVRLCLTRREKNTADFYKDSCIAKVDHPQAMLGRYRQACNHSSKRISGKGVRIEAGRVAAASKAEDAFGSFLRGLVLSRKDCVGKHIVSARGPVIKCEDGRGFSL